MRNKNHNFSGATWCFFHALSKFDIHRVRHYAIVHAHRDSGSLVIRAYRNCLGEQRTGGIHQLGISAEVTIQSHGKIGSDVHL